jgi:hypothetical protein
MFLLKEMSACRHQHSIIICLHGFRQLQVGVNHLYLEGLLKIAHTITKSKNGSEFIK